MNNILIFSLLHAILDIQEGGIPLIIETVYDLLAKLCALMDKNMERKCAIQRTGMDEHHFKEINEKYEPLIKMVLNSIAHEYIFNSDELIYIRELIQNLPKDACDEIFHLAVAVEQVIPPYDGWLGETMFHSVSPMNQNYAETGIEIYPRTTPQWRLDKSERSRRRILNSYLKNYLIVRKSDISPFQFKVTYWNDKGLLRETKSGWELSIALSPAMNFAKLETRNEDTRKGHAVTVQGLKNEETVTKRILDIFDHLFLKRYSMIIFTECLGTEKMVDEIRKRMRIHPDYCTIVVLPTICRDNINRLIVLGPGGVTCLHHDKAAPFILSDENGIERRECLRYDNYIPILIT